MQKSDKISLHGVVFNRNAHDTSVFNCLKTSPPHYAYMSLLHYSDSPTALCSGASGEDHIAHWSSCTHQMPYFCYLCAHKHIHMLKILMNRLDSKIPPMHRCVVSVCTLPPWNILCLELDSVAGNSTGEDI